MNTDQIAARIQLLTGEKASLELSHAGMVQGNRKMNEEFQAQVIKNQTRFAQIAGALDELNRMRNGDAPTTEKTTP